MLRSLAELGDARGTLGTNDWYVGDVTVTTSGSDDVSTPVICTADQHLTDDTTGRAFHGSCTNDAGRTQDGAPLPSTRTRRLSIPRPKVTEKVLRVTDTQTSQIRVAFKGKLLASGR